MKLSAVLRALEKKGFEFAFSGTNENPTVSDVVCDSRKVLPGAIFCCIEGEKADGHQ
jgi:UDP-N-acetylmuramyl pentapeptide synthase